MTKLDSTLQSAETEQHAAKPAPAPARRLLWIAAGALIVLALLVLGGWWLRVPELHSVLLQSPRQADDFTLTASSGEPLALGDLRGKFVLIYFGYTSCPDVCPTTLNDLKQMAAALGEQRMQDVQIVLISVDPQRDTPERLALYLNSFDPRFLGMTGELEDVQRIASQFGIFFEAQPGTPDTGYLVDHTSVVTVVDPDGYVRMIFPYGTTGKDMAADMTYLMRRG
ncbi:MAG: SCO family protein [Caldilineaceae bacterium]|nr:SCO family protein [Caldilineaceae bacterium]